MPLPMVPATAVPKTKAAMKFQKAAHATARNGVSTRVETTVAMELAASCQPFENSNARVSAMTAASRVKLVTGDIVSDRSHDRHSERSEESLFDFCIGEARSDWEALSDLRGFQDDAFNDVGDVFAFVDGGFDHFENLFPLDDLHRVFFLVK